MGEKTKKKGSISYAKWGYIFIAPFFLIFAVFQLIPLASTIYYSFFEYYRSGLKIIGPNFVGLKNYATLFATDLPKYFSNTLLLWIIGFIPQIAISLLLAAWFTDLRLKLKGQTFFKTVIYMPNLIMASAFAMLFFALFSDNGPVNAALMGMGILKQPFSFLNTVWGNRGLIGLMNFLMWFGNTTIMLMAAIMGVDPTLYEAAELDGCTPNQMFWKITIPLIRPILVYVMITSMIGGLQMFDVPQILTNGKGGPDRTSTTMIMYLNNHLFSKNYGMAGAVSVVLVVLAAVGWLFWRLIRKTRFKERIHSFFKGLKEGLLSVKDVRHKGLFVFYSLFIWLMYFLMFYVCFFCFQFTSHLGALVGLTIFVLSSYGMVAPVQGGIGAWHFMVIAALMIYLPHTPNIESMAKTFALLTHGTMTLLYIVVGVICVILLPLYNNAAGKQGKDRR